jgi:hypothetical protein
VVVRRVPKERRRMGSIAVGLLMMGGVVTMAPGPARVVVAIAGVLLIMAGLWWPERTSAKLDDLELTELVHRRLAEQDEKVVQRLDRIINDLRERNTGH